jgi:Ca2+-binding RTX toxin-like protein
VRRALVLAVLLCLAAALPAQAATVSFAPEPHKIKVRAAAGEVNDITITHSPGHVSIADASASVRLAPDDREGSSAFARDEDDIDGDGDRDEEKPASTSCMKDSDTEIRCPLPAGDWRVDAELGDQDDKLVARGPVRVEVDAGDGADLLESADADDKLRGGPGNDRLAAGRGPDILEGGDGDDTLLTRDGGRDLLACGNGSDTVEADVEDEVGTDCERVDKPLPPPTIVDPPAPVDPADPDPVDPGDEADLPKPQPGRTVAVTVKKGHVFVVRPGGQSTPVDPTKPLPVGSVLDTTKGTLTLTAASDLAGKTQSADFTGGTFAVAQKRGKVMTTELQLRGGDFSKCGAVPSRATARAASKRRVRRLWGSGHGRFTTRGRNSSATVRGTVWSVEDRCDGTLTRVERGSVLVKDLRTRRTKLIRKGQSFFVRAKRAASKR